MGELRIIRRTMERLAARGVTVTVQWEPAYHNRVKRGMSNGRVRLLARLNHGCDLLAGAAARAGRSHELDYYGALAPLQDATLYWSAGGKAVVGDAYSTALRTAASVSVARVLHEEERRPFTQQPVGVQPLLLAVEGHLD
eukprot:7163202-Prymnesium_polylepis.1